MRSDDASAMLLIYVVMEPITRLETTADVSTEQPTNNSGAEFCLAPMDRPVTRAVIVFHGSLNDW